MISKRVLRKVIGARKDETIRDAFDRHTVKIKKLFYVKKFNENDVEIAIKSLGIEEGDIVLVHCSWRNMFNFVGSPENLIRILEKIVGSTGTILMPCYGNSREYLDVDNTPSAAGVLSEVFRNTIGVKRSQCTHFSISGRGPDVDELLNDHFNSIYGFDSHSPLYKLGQKEHGKVLFIGLGENPTKISLFHCAGFSLKDVDPKLAKLLSKEYKSELVVNGISYSKSMIIRQPGHQNNHKTFRVILNSLKSKTHAKISNVDFVAFSAKEGLTQALFYAKKGIYCYKNMDSI